MGFRFRKSISILPGLKLNVSKSGVSATLGKKGASLNLGSKGVKGTVGIPGSGLSYDKMLFSTKEKKSLRRENRPPSDFNIKVQEDGAITFLDRKERPYDADTSSKIKKEYKEEIMNDLKQYVDELNVLNKHIQNVNEWFGKNENQFISSSHYIPAKNGDIESMEVWLETVLVGLYSPIHFSGSYDVECESGIWLDIDLPEIEELPIYEYSVSPTLRVLKKEKTKKQLKKEYAYLVSLIALLLAETLFTHLPRLENIVISGYTQRLNASIGQMEDQYIYSLLIQKEEFKKMRLTHIDVIHSLQNFRSVMQLSANYDWKTISPYYKE